MKQLEDWRSQEVEGLLSYLTGLESKVEQMKAEHEDYYCLKEYKQITKQNLELLRLYDDQRVLEVEKIIDKHYKALQSKVETLIGKILEIEPLNNSGTDYRFKGTNGNAQVKVVLAGGHNIQRKHTRWTVTKNK